MAFYRRGLGDVFSAAAELRVIGDVQFRSPKAAGNWRAWAGTPLAGTWTRAASAGTALGSESQNFGIGGYYTPPDDVMISRAQENWDKLNDAIDLSAPNAGEAYMTLDRLRNTLRTYIANAENINDAGGFGDRGGQVNDNLRYAYNTITQTLEQFANQTFPDPIVAIAVKEKQDTAAKANAAKVAAAQAEANAKRQQTQDAIAQAQAAIAVAEHAKAQADAAAQTHRQAQQESAQKHAATMQSLSLPLMLVVGGTVAVAAVFALRGRKRLGGYRRRRR